MTNEDKFNSYIDLVKRQGNEELKQNSSLWPAELLARLAMNLFEKETQERVDKVFKKKDNVINLDRSSKPPVDSL